MNKVAFVFPGQGSQSVGMIADLYHNHQLIRDTITEASDNLSIDLHKLIFEGPVEELNRTDNTQPALLTCSVALFRHWQEVSSYLPDVMTGHSLGEYSALVCSGVMTFADALQVVTSRGKYMMGAVSAGSTAMAAVLGLDDHLVEQACFDAAEDQVVSPINYNSPGQLVIAGHKEAVSRAIELCKNAGATRVLPIPVSVPSHCSLMKPAADMLGKVLYETNFSEPTIPVIYNVNVALETSSDELREALIRQLYSPVRWTETIQFLQQQGIETIVECGPGKVLAGLCKRIDRSITALVTCDQAGFDKAVEALN